MAVLIDVVEGGGELVVVQAVLWQVFDDEQLQLAQFLVGRAVMLREGIDIIVVGGMTVDQRLHIGEERLLLIFHVAAYLVGIFVVEAEDEFGEGFAFVERLLQLATDIGQLEVEEVGMTGLQIVEQGGDGQLFVGLEFAIAVDVVVDHCQEGIGIYIVILTRFHDRLVAEAQTDAEAAQHLQQVVVIANQRDHLVIRLIHLLIFHLRFTY